MKMHIEFKKTSGISIRTRVVVPYMFPAPLETFSMQVSTDQTFFRSKISDKLHIFFIYCQSESSIVGAVLEIEPQQDEDSQPPINIGTEQNSNDASHAIGHTGGD